MSRRQQEYLDNGVRNAVEGWFGVGKKRYSLDKIMIKLIGTSETVSSHIHSDELGCYHPFFGYTFDD